MTFGSLFAGIGGGDLGFARAGWECKWQVEIDPYCWQVLWKHWPNIPKWDDVRTFPPDINNGWDVTCIIGGFPCKQTSNAAAVHGRRNGLDGKDSGLWWHMLRVVKALRPEWAVVENVSGAATWDSQIKGSLAEIGYAVQRSSLEASDFGAPHRRRRVFWIANRDGKRLAIPRPEGPPALNFESWRAANGNPWLSSLARIGRVDDGVPGRVDRRKRIEACGNALMPAMAQWIARHLIKAMTETKLDTATL